MNLTVIENDPLIRPLVSKIEKKFKNGQYIVSDIIQKEKGLTYQYVDLVMEGGGVLGIALVGYIYALEKAGIRFLSIGGTSAGSIAALMLMAVDDRDQIKSDKLIEILFGLDIKEFIDGDDDAKDFSLFLGQDDLSKKKIKAIWKGAQVIDNVVNDLGLNPGDTFVSWLEENLKASGVSTLKDLKHRINYLPDGLQNRTTSKRVTRLECELALVTADITTETKVVFPEMAPLYWAKPDNVNPALFVRASMSIPLFFQPFQASGLTRIPGYKKKWKELAGYEGKIPSKVYFQDGGIMSNFPINLFHVDGVPLAPTFGVKLNSSARKYQSIDGPISYLFSMFNSIRHYADFDFLARNPDYSQLITYINTEDHNWLNFFMKDKEKLELFRKGVLNGFEFLEQFDWKKYKKVRGG